jgi:predicted phage terminase large subunit-like protein
MSKEDFDSGEEILQNYKHYKPNITFNAGVIEGFVKLFLHKNFDDPVNIPDCHMEWWDMCTSPHSFVAIAAPRGHAKSTAITHSYTLANLCFQQRNFILVVSDTETQAKNFVQDIKRELLENEDLRQVFGIKELIKDMETDFIVKFNNDRLARVIAKGSEQKLRGVKWNNKRPDLIICDDIENDELVMNEDRRKKLRSWFSGALIPCRASKGIIRVVGTILHADSQLERLMPKIRKNKALGELEITPLMIRNSLRDYWYAAKYKAHNPDFSYILWPQRWTKEKLIHERGMYEAQGDLEKYSQEYLNVPIDESTAHFRSSDIVPMEKADRESLKVYYIGVDLAVTLDSHSDFTCFVIGGVDESGTINIVNVIRERMESPDIVETILRLNKKYDPQYFFFEKGMLTNSILPILEERMMQEDNYVSYQTHMRVVDKIQFSQSIKIRMRTHLVKFDKEADWYFDLEDELLGFPRKAHDDQVDALSMLGFGLKFIQQAPTRKEQEEQEYEEAYQDSGIYEQGRNEETGY